VGLKQATTGERERTSELFGRHSGAVYRYCLRRLRSPEEAEDAVQVTYLNAWRSLKRGFEPSQPRAWLFRIAANVCADVSRSTVGSRRLELRDPSALDDLAARENSRSDELLGLSEALRDLPMRQRKALLLREWQGLSYDEIASQMAVSDAAVETLLFRARNKVASTLANSEWRGKVATSARAVVLWPFVAARAKSTAIAGMEHVRVGLFVAGGAVVPLVTFGVLLAISGTTPTPTPQAAHGVAAARAESLPPVSYSGQERDLNASPVHSRVSDVRPEKPRDRPRGNKATREHPSNPAAPGSTPANGATAAASHDDKIVLCHGTHSSKKPGVTVSVSPHALAGLADDGRGAC
jgi:RNA polymerase sigma-70 factor (ECF subfamily)